MFEELIAIQGRIIQLQIDIEAALKKEQPLTIMEVDLTEEYLAREIDGGYKITIKAFPPKFSIHSQISFRNGVIDRSPYQMAQIGRAHV